MDRSAAKVEQNAMVRMVIHGLVHTGLDKKKKEKNTAFGFD